MMTKTRQQISRVLIGYCSVLWLTGSLSFVQGNVTAQWSAPHCPSGQTQNAPHNHNHCLWYCGGLDIQSGGAPGKISTHNQVGHVWNLGDISLEEAAFDGEFPPRGPPQGGMVIAWNLVTQEAAALL